MAERSARPRLPKAEEGSERISIHRLHHVGLTVADIDRSIAFYRSLFDVVVHGPYLREGPRVGAVTGYPGCSIRLAFLDFGRRDQIIELMEFTGGGQPVDPATGNAGAAHFAIVIDDLDRRYEELVGRGHRFVSPPVAIAPNPIFSGRVAYLIDPDDFRIELFEPDPPTAAPRTP